MEVRTVVRFQHFFVEEVCVLGGSEIREDREIVGVVELANQILNFVVRKRGLVILDHLLNGSTLHWLDILIIRQYYDVVFIFSDLLNRCQFLHCLGFNHLLHLSHWSFSLFGLIFRLRWSFLLSSLSGQLNPISLGNYFLRNILLFFGFLLSRF